MTTDTSTLLVPRSTARPKLSRRDRWLLGVLLFLSLIPTISGLFRLSVFAATTAQQGLAAYRPIGSVAMLLHVLGATPFLALGAFQVVPGVRRRAPRWHRLAGRWLAPAGVLAALAAMVLASQDRGIPLDSRALMIVRLVVGAMMVLFIALAMQAIRRRDFRSHGAWMLRAYALGLGAGTQVLTLLAVLAVERSMSPTGRMLAMAIASALNLIVAEWSLRREPHATTSVPMNTTAATTGETPTMQAAVYDRYGGPEVMHLSRVRKPVPGRGQVLIRVHASSLNSMDDRMIRANPFLVRLYNGLFRPRRRVLGADVAGVIEAVGDGVTEFVPGDRVMGGTTRDDLGGFAEYVVVRSSAVVRVSERVSFAEAASVPLAGMTALQAVRDAAKVRAGQHVLIHGAGGGVGTFLVQIAKAHGARVTAVCGPKSAAVVRSLGADRVLDYTTQDVANDTQTYDALFGVNGHRPLHEYRAMLNEGGTYVMIGGSNAQLFEALLLGKLRFAFRRRRIVVLTLDHALEPTDLAYLHTMMVDGRMRPIIDRTMPLSQVADALRYVERGHVRGKLVIEVRAA